MGRHCDEVPGRWELKDINSCSSGFGLFTTQLQQKLSWCLVSTSRKFKFKGSGSCSTEYIQLQSCYRVRDASEILDQVLARTQNYDPM